MLTLCVCVAYGVCISHTHSPTTHSSFTTFSSFSERKVSNAMYLNDMPRQWHYTNTHPCDVVREGKGRKIIYGEHCLYSCVRVYSARETREKLLYAKSISFLCILVFSLLLSSCFFPSSSSLSFLRRCYSTAYE